MSLRIIKSSPSMCCACVAALTASTRNELHTVSDHPCASCPAPPGVRSPPQAGSFFWLLEFASLRSLLPETQPFGEPLVELVLVAHELVGLSGAAHGGDAAEFFVAGKPAGV